MKKHLTALIGTVFALATLGAVAPAADASPAVGHSTVRTALKSTKVTVTVAKYHAHQWKVAVHLTKAGHPWSHKVTFQAYGKGTWVYLSSATTGRQGYLVFKTKPGQGTSYPLRVHVAGTRTTKKANSRTFHLPVR